MHLQEARLGKQSRVANLISPHERACHQLLLDNPAIED